MSATQKCICICHAIGIRYHHCYLYAVQHGKKKPLPKGRTRTKSLEKRVKDEGVELGHPKGKERFDALFGKKGETE